MLPMILWIRIRDENHSFRLLLPLLLVYILLLPFYVLCIIAYPFTRLSGSLSAEGAVRIFLHLPVLFSSMRGTEVEFHSNDSDISLFVK